MLIVTLSGVLVAFCGLTARLFVFPAASGHVYVMTASIPWKLWPYELAYEWGATVKALVFNRSC